MPQADPGPDYYDLHCARKYAATLDQLQNAADEAERQGHTKMLHHLMEAGTCEQDYERRRRRSRLPPDISDHIDKRRTMPSDRLISAGEAELIGQTFSIPPFATMESLTGQDMLDLADQYEGNDGSEFSGAGPEAHSQAPLFPTIPWKSVTPPSCLKAVVQRFNHGLAMDCIRIVGT